MIIDENTFIYGSVYVSFGEGIKECFDISPFDDCLNNNTSILKYLNEKNIPALLVFYKEIFPNNFKFLYVSEDGNHSTIQSKRSFLDYLGRVGEKGFSLNFKPVYQFPDGYFFN
jgi:hypothetical protein